MNSTRILIADDEAHVRNIVRLKLETSGYSVTVAIDGQDAFELAQEVRPALLITDLQMPRMTGLDLCLRLQNDSALSQIPKIMLTSRGDVLSDEQRKNAGIIKLLDKPFSPRELLKLVEETLPVGVTG